MGKIANGVNKIYFTMLYGNYCYIFIENFPQKFSPCRMMTKITFLVENRVSEYSDEGYEEEEADSELLTKLENAS